MNYSYRLKTNSTRTMFIVQKNTFTQQPPKHDENDKYKEKQKRELSEVGSDSYNRSLRRAFSRAKLLAFFNPDLTQFITFTYHENILDENIALKHMKLFLQKEKRNYKNKKKSPPSLENQKNQQKTQQLELSTFPHPNNNNNLTDVIARKKNQKNRNRRGCGNVENSEPLRISSQEFDSIFEAREGNVQNLNNPFKYIYVFERQKRGAIHVHMMCNEEFEYRINKNGHRELINWPHGFTSVLTIKDLDNDFKPYLYLFKYMAKAQRIGKSFIHTSRKSFDKIDSVDYDLYIEALAQGDKVYEEDYNFTLQNKEHSIVKQYFK